MTKRRLSAAGATSLRLQARSAIAIVLDAESVQRPDEEEFTISAVDVAARTGRPEYLVRRIGRDDFHLIQVPGRVVGYGAGRFYVADDEARARRRHANRNGTVDPFPPLERMIDPLSRADSIGNLSAGWDGEMVMVADN